MKRTTSVVHLALLALSFNAFATGNMHVGVRATTYTNAVTIPVLGKTAPLFIYCTSNTDWKPELTTDASAGWRQKATGTCDGSEIFLGNGYFTVAGVAHQSVTNDEANVNGTTLTITWTTLYNENPAPAPTTIYVPAYTYCGATAHDTDLGSVTAGVTYSSKAMIAIEKSGNGKGTVSFTSSDMQTGGDLNLGGDKSVTVRPSESKYINQDKTAWISDTNSSSIPLDVAVGIAASTGVHTSTLTATLTCE